MPNSEPATFREEFEKAFDKEFRTKVWKGPALWAAKWALEKAAEQCSVDMDCGKTAVTTEDEIRQYIKELSDPHAK